MWRLSGVECKSLQHGSNITYCFRHYKGSITGGRHVSEISYCITVRDLHIQCWHNPLHDRMSQASAVGQIMKLEILNFELRAQTDPISETLDMNAGRHIGTESPAFSEDPRTV